MDETVAYSATQAPATRELYKTALYIHLSVCLSVYTLRQPLHTVHKHTFWPLKLHEGFPVCFLPREKLPLCEKLSPPQEIYACPLSINSTHFFIFCLQFTFYGIRYTARKLHIQKLFSISNIALVVQIIISAEHSNLSFHSIAGWCQTVNLDGMYG